MTICRKSFLFISLALISATALAQEHDSLSAAEVQSREALEKQRVIDTQIRKAEAQQRVAEVQMREAEERLAAAARQIAELSSRSLPAVVDIERFIHIDDRVMLGITIGDDDGDGPVEGVTIRGISPGGAAEEAGLRSGDIITAVNGESMTAENHEEANEKLIDFMSGVEEGDALDVEYLRNGKQATVEVRPKEMSPMAFAFGRGNGSYSVPVAPNSPDFDWKFRWYSDGSGWGHMEMVTLTEGLGKYFGTDKGLLVVRAPEDENLELRDGDVIQSIDGREPRSVSHAMRILGSYQSGEELELQIMRDKRKQTLKIEMPDNRSSWVPRFAPKVESDVVVVPKVRIQRKERT
ncbi:MAG: PDZ domain-containing protein [Woeseia sp.]